MSHIIATIAKYSLWGGLFATGLWATAVYTQSSVVDRSKIVTSDVAPDDFRNSSTCRLVNPRPQKYTSDSRFIYLQVSTVSTSQRQVLVWLVNGFFQSWVFAPEAVVLRTVLKNTGLKFTRLSGKQWRSFEHQRVFIDVSTLQAAQSYPHNVFGIPVNSRKPPFHPSTRCCLAASRSWMSGRSRLAARSLVST